MNSYTIFSEYYDKLMHEDFDYEKIADFLENMFDRYDINANLICELACGTGNITIPMAHRGYDMTALDSSYEMLDKARAKAAQSGFYDILFLNQNMTALDLYGTVDAFYCLVDGMNYVLSSQSLFEMFKKIKTCFLEPGGLFIFDISTEYKLENIIGDNTFVHNGEDIFYTWENRYIKKRRISDMFLTFFAKTKNGAYRRFSERHLQKAHRPDDIVKMLKKAGFTSVDLYDGFCFDEPKENSERIVFAAR